MTLSTDEFMRRFLMHVLPSGFHRIRHYGLLANAVRKKNLVLVRELLHATPDTSPENEDTSAGTATQPTFVCPDCGAAMIIVETLVRASSIRAPPRHGGAQ